MPAMNEAKFWSDDRVVVGFDPRTKDDVIIQHRGQSMRLHRSAARNLIELLTRELGREDGGFKPI